MALLGRRSKRKGCLLAAITSVVVLIAVGGVLFVWSESGSAEHSDALAELMHLPSYPVSTFTNTNEDISRVMHGSTALLTFKTVDEPGVVQSFYKDIFLGKGWQAGTAPSDFQSSYTKEDRYFGGIILNIGQARKGPLLDVRINSARRTVTIASYTLPLDTVGPKGENSSVTVEYDISYP